MPKGIDVEDLVVGTGELATRGARVVFHCTTALSRGEVVRDSRTEPHGPTEALLGERELIAGIERGIEGMRAGGKRRLRIAPHLAYGARGVPGLIPPNALLVVEVELLEVSTGTG